MAAQEWELHPLHLVPWTKRRRVEWDLVRLEPMEDPSAMLSGGMTGGGGLESTEASSGDESMCESFSDGFSADVSYRDQERA